MNPPERVSKSVNLSRPSYSIWAGACAIVVATVIVYLPALHGGFLLDDDLLLTANPLIKNPNGWWMFWCTHNTPDYLPLMSDSFWAEWRLWGMNPAGYHVTNILLHAVSAVIFWLLLRRMGVPGAWIAAAIFAVHPVNVRSVAWIAERKNTLSMLFFLGTLLAFVASEDTRSKRVYWLAVALFACALLSKSSTVVLPMVLLIITWYRRRRITADDLRASMPFFAMSAIAAVAAIWYQYHVEIKPWNISAEPPLWRLASAGYSVWFYLGKLILPINLAMIYPRIQIDTGAPLNYLPLFLVIAALALFAWKRRTWGAIPLVVSGCFVATLLPVLGFVNMAFFKSSMVSDHLQYIPMLAIAAAAGAGIAWVMRRIGSISGEVNFGANSIEWHNKPPLGTVLPAIVLLTLAMLSWTQAGLYRDRVTLAKDTLRTNAGSFWAHGEMAGALASAGDLAGAERELRVVIALDPRSIAGYNNLANILIREQRYAEASELLVAAEQANPESVMVHMNLGLLYAKLGYLDQSRQEFARAARIDPSNAMARDALAQVGGARR
ncbi:MAG: tetratricopeptide repeat protein [Capsulimonadaceae bacterium]|nr:tetratricopeptide repeat protein [Capsulimonadaceae bacterium]